MPYFIPFALALALLLPASHAAAAPPSVGTGTVYLYPLAPPQISFHGGNQFVSVILATTQTGPVSGPGIESLTAQIHPDGTETFQAWQTVQATVDGRTGVATARIVGTGADGTNSGHITIVSASGGLTGLHGEGTFTGTESSANYTLKYQFAP